jgi:hypothetical protein
MAAWSATFYTSAINLSATGNTGVIATPLAPTSGSPPIFPLVFVALGNNMATDETNDLTIAWYMDAAGAYTVGTTTFNQLTAGSLSDVEGWPGDVTFYDAGRDMVPLHPYCKITHTLAGTTKSMGYTLMLSYMYEG